MNTPSPEVIRITHAFFLGARTARPDANVRVVWTKAWHDPATASEAPSGLLDLSAEVIAMQSHPPAPVQTAQRRGAFIGYNVDTSTFADETHRVSAVWH